jgi:hypothetical protein
LYFLFFQIREFSYGPGLTGRCIFKQNQAQHDHVEGSDNNKPKCIQAHKLLTCTKELTITPLSTVPPSVRQYDKRELTLVNVNFRRKFILNFMKIRPKKRASY